MNEYSLSSKVVCLFNDGFNRNCVRSTLYIRYWLQGSFVPLNLNGQACKQKHTYNPPAKLIIFLITSLHTAKPMLSISIVLITLKPEKQTGWPVQLDDIHRYKSNQLEGSSANSHSSSLQRRRKSRRRGVSKLLKSQEVPTKTKTASVESILCTFYPDFCWVRKPSSVTPREQLHQRGYNTKWKA